VDLVAFAHPVRCRAGVRVTRDEFFLDVAKALRLLAGLGIPELQAEAEAKMASMKAGGPGIDPRDLRRYADAIDWTRQHDARLLGELVETLLRILAGLASELESFRQARE
jgi:hypothetical protein